MDLTKKIIAMENNSKQGESQVYKCIDAASLHKLYKFYKNASVFCIFIQQFFIKILFFLIL